MTRSRGPGPARSGPDARSVDADRLVEPKPTVSGTPARPADRLTLERRHLARSMGVWSVVVAASAALLALPRVGPVVPRPAADQAPTPTGPPAISPLNLASFDAPVWLTRLEPPPAPEVKPPPPAAPAPPPRLELLGIERIEDDQGAHVYRAVLYDLDAKRVLVVKAGDRLEPRLCTIAAVTPTNLTIADGPITHTFSLKSAPRASSTRTR